MAYIALARKYRPQSFADVVGQEQTTDSLVHLLDHKKLHQCYLFSGTRGVGKTTLARIIAKAVNCQNGMSGNPCNKCDNCFEISNGNFIDVIEIDAASRTKVEDTRDMLEQVRYLPSKGLHKIYIIDEVHMLSNHSFNALLKTLEEPPEHVCFILATTHPHKLPPTILSRCLHYELSPIKPSVIADRMAQVLEQEKIKFEQPAVETLAVQAQGSMRDALSLLDRVLGSTQDLLENKKVCQLLGVSNQSQIWQLMALVIAGDVATLLANYHAMQSHQINAIWLLDGLLNATQNLALQKQVKEANWLNVPDEYSSLSDNASDEQLQLYYQIILKAKQDLPFMPNDISGIEMILLRLIAFSPMQNDDIDNQNRVEIVKKKV